MRYAIILSVLLTGCATKQGFWQKEGTSQQEFMQDRGQCIAQAYSAPNPRNQAFVMAGCMQGKGWQWVEG